MEVNIKLFCDKFSEFNRQIFGDELPSVVIKTSNASTYAGKYQYYAHPHSTHKVNHIIILSNKNSLTERELEDVLIHEMIHCYITVKGYKDTGHHGKIFLQIMTTINQQYGRNISVRTKRKQFTEDNNPDDKPRVVVVLKLKTGNYGFKVVQATKRSIEKFLDLCRNSANLQFTDYEIYISYNPFFKNYPASTGRYCLLPKDIDTLKQHLREAKKVKLK